MKYLNPIMAMVGMMLVCTCTEEVAHERLPAEPVMPITVTVVPVTQAAPAAAVPEEPGESPLEEAILDRAEQCPGAKVGKFDRKLLRDMLRSEEDHAVPLPLRGMVLAAACVESGFDPGGEGDHNFSRTGKPLAIGILQQWPWWSTSPTGPKINRRDPRQAADAWLAHVARQVPSVTRKCSFRASQTELIWRTAWVTGVRAPSKKPRCTQVSKHWKTFVNWRTAWEDQIQPKTIAQR